MGSIMEIIRIHQFREKLELLGYSKRTALEYPRKIERFLRYVEAHEMIKSVVEITSEHINAYHTYLQFGKADKGRDLTIKTVCCNLGAIKVFYRIMHREGLLPYDLSEAIQLPLVRKHIPRNVPSVEDMQKILDAAEPLGNLAIRDRAMLEFLYATAIRSEELRIIRIGDYDISEHTVFITGKGSKDRIVPVGAWVEPYIVNYLEKSRPYLVGKKKTDLLFVSKNGCKLSKSNLWRVVKHYAEIAGVNNAMPHGFRHACATHLLQNGADIRIIQELLGHSTLASTQIYTRVDIHNLQQAHTKFHPRERW
jgi:integrase/recombinase XerD